VQTDRQADRQTDNRGRTGGDWGFAVLRLEGEARTGQGRRALVCRLAASERPEILGRWNCNWGSRPSSPCTHQKE
jgi:hypothetical protein